MNKHYEESLQRDIDRIRRKVTEMGALAERALKRCLRALGDVHAIFVLDITTHGY